MISTLTLKGVTMKNSTLMYSSKLYTFYTEQQAIKEAVGLSRSPMKPYLLMEKLKKSSLSDFLEVHSNFSAFSNEDFEIAHEKNYVEEFFDGIDPSASSNLLTWSRAFADTVRFTNSSLYNAQKYAVENPSCITFSPTSGFHHAVPISGRAFCTFSGQVISAVKLYREKGTRTAWIDMDGHTGNSIEDSRKFVPELNDAIPIGMNFNPRRKSNQTCLEDLSMGLQEIKEQVLQGNIDSICFAQGADSHIWDDLRVQETMLNTTDWVTAHSMVFQAVKELSDTLKKPIPLTISLFGGYRKNDYDSVLNLHLLNLQSCLEILCGVDRKYEFREVLDNRRIFLDTIKKR